MKSISAIRDFFNLTQTDLGRLLGLSLPTVWRIENKVKEPDDDSRDILEKLEALTARTRPPKVKAILRRKGRLAVLKLL